MKKTHRKEKRKGIIGVDRSGSRGDYPIVVVSIYSDKAVNFYNAIKEVKDRLGLGGFIKGKDFKMGSYQKIIEIIKKKKVKFNVLIVNQDIYTNIEEEIRWKKDWEMKLEAHLWSKIVLSLINKIKTLPNKIFYERTYKGTGNDAFDNVFKSLVNNQLKIKEIFIGDKREPQIILADWIAHFFYKDKRLNNLFRDDIHKLRDKEIGDIKNKIQFTPSSRHNRSPRNDWNSKYKDRNYINLSVKQK